MPDPDPAFALIHLPDGWPDGGTIEKLLLVMVRDGVPDRGLVVDAVDVQWHQVTGNLAEMRQWLESVQPKRRKKK